MRSFFFPAVFPCFASTSSKTTNPAHSPQRPPGRQSCCLKHKLISVTQHLRASGVILNEQRVFEGSVTWETARLLLLCLSPCRAARQCANNGCERAQPACGDVSWTDGEPLARTSRGHAAVDMSHRHTWQTQTTQTGFEGSRRFGWNPEGRRQRSQGRKRILRRGAGNGGIGGRVKGLVRPRHCFNTCDTQAQPWLEKKEKTNQGGMMWRNWWAMRFFRRDKINNIQAKISRKK